MRKTEKQLNYIKEHYNIPNVYFGCYVEAYGKYAGILNGVSDAYIVVKGNDDLILHPTDNIIYYDNSISKNVIYDFREK